MASRAVVYDRQVPKFLQAYIKSNPTPEQVQEQKFEAKQKLIEDRPDRFG